MYLGPEIKIRRLRECEVSLQVLVVEDDSEMRKICVSVSKQMGFDVVEAESVAQAMEVLKFHKVDVLLLDLKLPDGGGLPLLEHVKTLHPDTAVVVMTAFATVSSAVEAMRIGARDYLTKPFSLEELTTVLERASQSPHFDRESRLLREKLRSQKDGNGLIGRSPEMEKLYRILSKVAFSTHPVLILGESGTGKEMVARAIHFNGPNAGKPFILVDCRLAPALIERELFGNAKSPRGIDRAGEGALAASEGGTVFLDEIGELPLELQAKLLRVLQEKEVRAVGATESRPLSVRVLAATSRDLAAMVEQGKFRKDLSFRLNVVSLRIPSLRERKGDIRFLAMHFLARVEKESGVERTFSDEFLRWMMEYDWPGNVRELENAIEQACQLSSDAVLDLKDMPIPLQELRMQRTAEAAERLEERVVPAQPPSMETPGTGEILSIAEMERQAILGTIRQLNGDKLLAAKLLGIGKTTLYRKLKEYGIVELTEE